MAKTKSKDLSVMGDVTQNQSYEFIESRQTATKRGVSKMLRFIHLLYIILFLFIPVFSASGNIKTVDTSSVIQVKGNLLTVKVKDILLTKVLMEIAKQKHIKFDFYASAEDTIITNFSRLPIEKGLAKLLRNYSYAFTYGSEKSKGGEHEIRKVVILSNGEGSQHRGMEPTIAYREEPHLYDEPYDEDLDYQESEDMYHEEPDMLGEDIPDSIKKEDFSFDNGYPTHFYD